MVNRVDRTGAKFQLQDMSLYPVEIERMSRKGSNKNTYNNNDKDVHSIPSKKAHFAVVQ